MICSPREGTPNARPQFWIPRVSTCLTAAGRIQGSGDQVEAFQGGLFVGKWPRASIARR